MMPRKGLNTESKISACSGALSSPFGAGMRATIASSTSSTPCPVLPEASRISSSLHPIRSITWSFTSSIMAESMSILFNTGMISRSCPTAR